MRRKYFFFDIDHTLGLGISSIIPADTAYCLRRLQQCGHFVAIATGRLQCDAQRFADRNGIGAVVSDGGSSLSLGGRIISMEGLPLDACKALLREADACRLPWAVVTDNSLNRYTPYASFPHADPKNYMNTIVCPVDIDSLDVVYKITYAQPADGAAGPCRHGLPHLTYLDRTYLVEPTDKGQGILRMLEHIGGDPADAVVFGDGLNDLSMFCRPFFSVAMGNAKEELKARADYVTDDNDKGGILHTCIKFGWI